MSQKEGLHKKLERGIDSLSKRVERAMSDVEVMFDGPRLAVGDRVRLIATDFQGMTGTIDVVTDDGYIILVKTGSGAKAQEVVVQCRANDVERVQ